MLKLAEVLAEVSALESKMSKTAAKKANPEELKISSILDKLAADMESEEEAKSEGESSEQEAKENEEGKEDEEEEGEEEEKEASMKLTNTQVDKIATRVVQLLEKIAVDAGPNTQGCAINVSGNNSGVLTDEARAFDADRLLSGDSVASDANSNPEKNAPQGGSMTSAETGDPNEVGDRPAPLQGGEKGASVVYTRQEADVLQKLAQVGYAHIVDVMSDKIVHEKIAAAMQAEIAKDAPQKIAQAILAKKNAKTEKTAAPANPMREKLAEIGKKDPELLGALKVLADRKLL